jgi:geranylgeranyl diphosphate synthase, type II
MTKTSSDLYAQFSQRAQPQIDAALDRCSQLGDGCPTRLREAIGYSLLAPGKRLRPMLVLMAAEACGGRIEAALPAAAAVEMVHAYSLIHDDLPAMDDDDLRRGRPTCHKAFGEATAILAGDALLTLAFETLAGLDCPPQVVAQCVAALAEAAGACGMVGGQADDVECGCTPSGGAPSESAEEAVTRLESIHRRKTGAMISVAIQLGGLIAWADPLQQAALAQYGERLGLAFQITDDVLDVRGDEAALGKRVRKDSRRGKLTFPGLLGVEASLRRAEELIDGACEALAPLGPSAGVLESLARHVLDRNR